MCLSYQPLQHRDLPCSNERGVCSSPTLDMLDMLELQQARPRPWAVKVCMQPATVTQEKKKRKSIEAAL